jgi:acylphosphatase
MSTYFLIVLSDPPFFLLFPNAPVEAVFEGEKERVNSVLEWCRDGPSMARVNKVATRSEDHKNEFHNFQVLP